jgi:endoglucanase
MLRRMLGRVYGPMNTLFPLLVCSFGLCGLIFAHPAAGRGYLHTEGTRIVDSSGQPLLLRGVNLGNWLYREPWMIGNTQFAIYGDEYDRPDEMEDAITDLVGPERTAEFDQAWRDNFITRADIQQIAHWGFNSVRVPLDYRLFYDHTNGHDLDTGFRSLDPLLAWCAAAHIYVILDMHGVPGGKNNGPNGLFADPAKQAILAHVWSRIAGHYADNTWIGGYDLVNEPALWNQPELLGTYEKLTTAIRAADTHHCIIVEGDHWASRLDLIGVKTSADLWDKNIVFSDHDYGSPVNQRPGPDGAYSPYTLPQHEELTATLKVPLWMGEFGYNSNTWDREMRDKDEAGQVGWCYWAYKAPAIWTLTSFPIPSGYHALQAYWAAHRHDPNTPKPSADEVFQSLMALAQATNFRQCVTRKDVVDALTRPDFMTRAVPYQSGLTIPGTILAVDYDMGAEGIASHDTVASDMAGKGPAGEAWNSGWNFRNDGVDITPVPDGGDEIFDIEPGEWTDYTVHCTPGTYAVSIRYRSASGGSLHLLLDGQPLGAALTLPPSADPQMDAAVNVGPVTLTAHGAQTLRLAYDSAGFRLESITFRRK